VNAEQKIANVRLMVAGLVKSKNDAHAGGARFHLLDSGTVIETLLGYCDGVDSAGAQSDDERGAAMMKAIAAGAQICIGTVGYTSKGTK